MTTIRVVVADDMPTIRLGFRMIVDHEDDMVVVGEAGTGTAAVDVARTTLPDVVLMDIRMPDGDGIAAVRALTGDVATASVRSLVLTTFDDEEYVAEALRAGASGFLLKDCTPDELVAAVRRVHAGGAMLDPALTRHVIEGYLAAGPVPRPGRAGVDSPPLTPREREVLGLVARGANNAQIAQALDLGEATVKSHVRSILAKLGLTSRVQLVVWAYDAGIAVPRDG